MTEQASYGLAAFVLTMFGVAMPLPAFVGGLMVANGMCFAVMMVRPIGARRTIALTLLMGSLAGLFAAMLHKNTGAVWVWGSLPVQAQMGLAGALSQGLFELLVSRGKGAIEWAADKAGLPGAGGDSR